MISKETGTQELNIMEQAKYSVRAYCTDTDGGYDDEQQAETVKEARERAKRMMTDDYLRVVESTVPVVYVEVINNKTGERVFDLGSPLAQ
jgi:hypothetical protein